MIFLKPHPFFMIGQFFWRTLYSTHGLFLTCTQKSHLYLHNIHMLNIYTMYSSLFIKPFTNNKESLLTWSASFLLVVANFHPPWPHSGSICPTPWLLPLSPLSPLSHPLSPHYIVYKDDINNHGLLHGLLHLGHVLILPI